MKALVVTHEVTLSGAPRIALLVARLLRDAGHDVQALSRADGPMVAQFAAVVPTSIELAHRWRARLWRRAPRWLALPVDGLLAALTLLVRRPDLVYVNSTSASIYARAALWTRRPAIVLHVHESGINSGYFLSRAGLRDPGAGIHIVACSPSVHRELAVLLERQEPELSMLPSVPDDVEVRARAVEPPRPGWPDSSLVVGCCGTVERRKGVDLWQRAALQVRLALPDTDLRFPWVGSAPFAGTDSDPVDFIGAVANPYPYLERFDVLVLPSRDDPFPLVVLEAMLLGTPVVAFDVGAVRDQIGDTGTLVPAEDTDALAAAVTGLLLDDAERRRLGVAAAARARDQFSTDAFARGLADVVARASASRRAQASLTQRHRSAGGPRVRQVVRRRAAEQP